MYVCVIFDEVYICASAFWTLKFCNMKQIKAADGCISACIFFWKAIDNIDLGMFSQLFHQLDINLASAY